MSSVGRTARPLSHPAKDAPHPQQLACGGLSGELTVDGCDYPAASERGGGGGAGAYARRFGILPTLRVRSGAARAASVLDQPLNARHLFLGIFPEERRGSAPASRESRSGVRIL